jgi:hypothetical protein
VRGFELRSGAAILRTAGTQDSDYQVRADASAREVSVSTSRYDEPELQGLPSIWQTRASALVELVPDRATSTSHRTKEPGRESFNQLDWWFWPFAR